MLIKLLKINQIATMFYSRGRTDIAVVYGLGAPIVPDFGNLPDASYILKFPVDLFVPDYIGYGRSDGVCTPRNCIRTFLLLYDWLTKGCLGINHYEGYRQNLKYKRVIFIGRSFGGTYVPLLPRFNPKITELGLIYPAVDNASCGNIPGEETNKDFMRAMKSDGYRHLYRGILSPIWIRHLNNEDSLSPMDNIEHLESSRLFIGHGKQDKCIHYSKSQIYYRKILQCFPNRKSQFVLKLYAQSGHEPKTSNQAVVDFLKWLKL